MSWWTWAIIIGTGIVAGVAAFAGIIAYILDKWE